MNERRHIGFSVPFPSGAELDHIEAAIENMHLSGNGPYSRRCAAELQRLTGAKAALLTHSATGALEMGALLFHLGPGDEVVMPSFTFVSTANAVVLRGATPVFVDVRADTLNIDVDCIAGALSPRTKAIFPVHYAGVPCEMEPIRELAAEHGLLVMEDAAQALGSSYRDRQAGSLGNLAALSFHETKNIMCGEGGALLINDEDLIERAEILQEKGTDRSKFFRGEVDKYTWVDVGSSFLLSDLSAAFLWAQLEAREKIQARRLAIWDLYDDALRPLEERELLRRPIIPPDCRHNAHLYYVLLPTGEARDIFITRLREAGIHAVFHYVPLHDSPAGSKYARAAGDLRHTTALSGRLARLPLWAGMSESDVDYVIEMVVQVTERLPVTTLRV